MKEKFARTNKIMNMGYVKLLLNVGLIFATFSIKNSKSCEVNACYETDNELPKHYSIWLTPNMEMENETFEGKLVVSFKLHRDFTNNFTMDLHNIRINETETIVHDVECNESFVPKEYHYNNIKQTITLFFKKDLVQGDYILTTKFTGVSIKDVGFYTKSYMSDNTKQMVAVTQMKDFTARKIFPCWDHPHLRTTFNISVKHHKKYKVLSNMPEIQTKSEQKLSETDMVWTEFETTPNISTHHLAVLVFNPVYISNVFTSETVNIWCRPHLKSKIEFQFIHDVVNNTIRHLANYTSFSDVPMINIVLLPDSLITSTVSGWALIIYSESDFTEKYQDSITGMKKRHIANIIAEHVVRHWFGNLVTPSKWLWVWVRDGLAMFFKSYVLNMIFKDWRSMDMLVVENIRAAFHYDNNYMPALVSNEKNFLLSLLNNNEYVTHVMSGKAPAILRMLQLLVGEKIFHEGIISYIRDNAYYSASSADVWHGMQSFLIENYFKSFLYEIHIDNFSKYTTYYNAQVSPKTFSIKTAMDNYVKHNHYPLVYVKRNYTSGETKISQECFSSQDNKTIKWWVPVTYATQTNPDFSKISSFVWLLPQNESITLTVESNDWIIVNLQQYGYYRVNYDKTNWQKIVDYLNSDEYVQIHVLNRAQLIDDAYALVKYKKLEVSIFLNLTKYLTRETDYIVWYTMFRIFTLSSQYFLLSESENLKLHFSEILGSRLEKLGYKEDPNEDDFIKMERLNATYWACYFNNTKCKSEAASELHKFLDDSQNYNVLPHWREWTYCAGLMTANFTVWNKAKDVYFNKTDEKFYEFLACVEEPQIIIVYLNILIYSENLIINIKNINDVFNFIVKKHASKDEVFNYILNNFENFAFDTSDRYSLINRIILNIHSLTQLNRVENLANKLFKPKPDILGEIRDIIEIRRNNLEFITDFFQRFL